MKILWFEGSSDDTFGLTRSGDNTDACDDYCDDGDHLPIWWRIHSPEQDQALLVYGKYSADEDVDGWVIGIAPTLDAEGLERHFADWNVHFEHGAREHSPRLVIEAPDDVQVDCITRLLIENITRE